MAESETNLAFWRKKSQNPRICFGPPVLGEKPSVGTGIISNRRTTRETPLSPV